MIKLEDKITIYDPIHLKKYKIDFNELRFWLDIPSLQRLFETSDEAQDMFQDLEGPEREYLLQLLDKNEVTIPFKINNWEGINGMSVSFTLNINYNIKADGFHDTVNQNIKDQLFFNKNLKTIHEEGNIYIMDKAFPVRKIIAVSEDFCKIVELSPNTPFPIFESYIGNGSNFPERFFLNRSGEVEPLLLNYIIKEDGEWTYELEVKIEPTVEHKNVLWKNIPYINQFFDFFRNKGYQIRSDGNYRTYIEDIDQGNIIEYNNPPEHLYNPFISIREHNFSKHLKDRDSFGKQLIKDMKKEGLWEEITYFRAYLIETEAMGKIGNKNKRQADELLSKSIMEYDKCSIDLQTQAQLEAIFCAWLKGLIAKSNEDEKIELRSYKNILERYASLHMWEDFLWFLERLERVDKDYPYQLVRDFLPVYEIEKFFFMRPKTYRRLLEYWDKGLSKERRPKRKNLSEWHYKTAHRAYDIGLKNTARHHILTFFRLAERDPEACEWAIEGTEELLEFAVKVQARKQYLRFSQTMSKHMRNKRRTQGIGDMSAIGRKAYRWTMLTLTLSEARWSFHSGYILKNERKEKPDKIKEWFRLAYESLYEALLHYDYTESYSLDQVITIAKGFVTGYHLGFSVRDENLMLNMLELSYELWENNPSKELYLVIHSLFQTSERKKMADALITNWIDRVKEREGTFELNTEKVLILSDLYVSIEEWEEATKTLNHGLNNFDWDFSEVNEAFKIFSSIQKFAPNTAFQLEEGLYNQMQKFQKEKIDNADYAKGVRVRINRVNKV